MNSRCQHAFPLRTRASSGNQEQSSIATNTDSTPFASPLDHLNCPRCGRETPEDAVLCVDCGTNVSTGRRLVTAKVFNKEEEIARLRRGWLSAVTLVLPLGISPYASEVPLQRQPIALYVFIILNVIVFPSIYFSDATIVHFALWGGALANSVAHPILEFQWFQLGTHIFLHGDPSHLIFNMLIFVTFGPRVNDLLGNIPFLLVCVGLGGVAGIAHLVQSNGGNPTPLVGASGAGMALVGMYTTFSPMHHVRMTFWLRFFVFSPAFFEPFRVRGIWLVVLFAVLDVVSLLTGNEDQVAHGVHVLGFVAGFLFALILTLSGVVTCQGYDLVTSCFGQRNSQGDV